MTETISLQVGDYARCQVPLKKPGKWGNLTQPRTVVIRSLHGQYVKVSSFNRSGEAVVKRDAIEYFWRSTDLGLARSAGHPCGAWNPESARP